MKPIRWMALLLGASMWAAQAQTPAPGADARALPLARTTATCPADPAGAEAAGTCADEGRDLDAIARAAAAGSARAQAQLGEMYYTGQGVGQDFGQALLWNTRAAAQGQAGAQFRVGDARYFGRGTASDEQQAYGWYLKAAEQGLTKAQAKVALMLENGNGVAKNARQAAAWYARAGVVICATAAVPNPSPQADESTQFYGRCDASTVPQTGIVVWHYKDYPVGISCLSNGSYTSPTSTAQFEPCQQFWQMLPEFCTVNGYAGQCKNGVAHGVGYESGRGATTFVRSGVFENGVLHGYGRAASVSGCGMAGCSGNRVNEVGWFVNGARQIDCSSYTDCIGRLSGKLLALERRHWAGGDGATPAQLRSRATFNALLEAYALSGDKADLKQAQALARTPAHKAALEYALMQTAGFDKVLAVSATVVNGKQSVSTSDQKQLLGFFSAINSNVPVSIKWTMKSNAALLPLRAGAYKVTLRLGLNVERLHHTCVLGFCQDRADTDRYVEKVVIQLSAKNAYQAAGAVDLAVAGAATTRLFGVDGASVIRAIDPVVAIESVEPLP